MRLLDKQILSAISSYSFPVGSGVLSNHPDLRVVANKEKSEFHGSLRYLINNNFITIDSNGGYSVVSDSIKEESL